MLPTSKTQRLGTTSVQASSSGDGFGRSAELVESGIGRTPADEVDFPPQRVVDDAARLPLSTSRSRSALTSSSSTMLTLVGINTLPVW